MLLTGAAGLYIDYRLEGTGKGKREWKFAGYAKETVIPGNWSAEYVRNVWMERRLEKRLSGEIRAVNCVPSPRVRHAAGTHVVGVHL